MRTADAPPEHVDGPRHCINAGNEDFAASFLLRRGRGIERDEWAVSATRPIQNLSEVINNTSLLAAFHPSDVLNPLNFKFTKLSQNQRVRLCVQQNSRVFKSGIFFIAVILLAGCAGNTVHRLPPSETAGVKGLLPTPPPTQPIPVVNYPPPVVPQTFPITTWTSLSDWAAQHHIGAPQRLNNLSVAAYAVAEWHDGYGEWRREVTWNGISGPRPFAAIH